MWSIGRHDKICASINFCERNKAHLNDCSAQNLQSHKRGNCLLKCILHIMTSYSWGYYTGESSPRPLYTGPKRCMYFLTKSLALFFTESLTSKSSTCRQYFSSLSKTACVSWNATISSAVWAGQQQKIDRQPNTIRNSLRQLVELHLFLQLILMALPRRRYYLPCVLNAWSPRLLLCGLTYNHFGGTDQDIWPYV